MLNTAPGPHWLRFSLSEAPAVKSAAGVADGRGRHPAAAPSSFSHGETEDYLQRPQPAGEDGTLTLTKTSSYAGGVVPFGGTPISRSSCATPAAASRCKPASAILSPTR